MSVTSQSPYAAAEAVGSEQLSLVALRVMEALDRWDLPEPSRAALLGLAPHLLTAHRGGRPLPCDEQCLQRATLILEIDGFLQQLYPEDEVRRRAWLATPSEELGENPPLAIAERHGFEGLQAVRALLMHRLCA